ncbi:nephrin-like isoform X1 [Phlebotomus papatasi]|uniref:nephrin-like isoform X1 n=2 Tax=Phlebotomus papatasi TaxID=29031 RepID=UPI0024836255|nr:nephrin-like isoform X1 [Phlebotomus papatasi]
MNYSGWLWTCALLLPKLLILASPASIVKTIEGENVPISLAEAVQGSMARLPCNITPPVPDDKITLVIWYKDGYVTPIYSFDARGSHLDGGSHWSDDTSIAGRGIFQAKTKPAILALQSSRSSDSGIYRCRVDFQKSPTRNSKVNLTVIIPPENVLILDEKGHHIPHYILGPYNEGASVDLTCVSTGGRPVPTLVWLQENSVLDDSFTVTEKRVKNVLHLEKLQRHHLHTVLTCQASNNNVTTPISSAITLDMNLRPLWVKLQGENRALSAGHSYELWCEVVGSRPAPTVTWWKGSTPMRDTRETTSPDGNTTISVLTFVPTIDDGGKFLSCRGEQPQIPDSGLEDGWKLDIHHVPVVSLELGSNWNITTIREGADVYFECNIKSNPWVYKVNWRHNGKYLYNNAASGIIVANQSLVLQNVSRARSGVYTCIGSNEEGDGESNPVTLDIKFAPVCRPGQVQAYGVGRQETAKISCELEANPNDLNFTWKFNNSAMEFVDLPVSQMTVDRAKSIMHYTPMTEQDYGTLLCWGSNELGFQLEPCIFTINPAGKPDPLSNCTVFNQTVDTLQLECIEGYNGGLPQEFIVRVYAARSTQVIASQTSKSPFFELKGLDPEVGYDVHLAAMNEKGMSEERVHHIHRLNNNAEKHTDSFLPYKGSVLHIKLFLGALAGLVFGIILITTATLLLMRTRRRKKANNVSQETMSTTTNGRIVSGQSIPAAEQHQLGDSYTTGSTDSLDKNPDIIPQGKEDSEFDDERVFHRFQQLPRQYSTLAMGGKKQLPVQFAGPIDVNTGGILQHPIVHYSNDNQTLTYAADIQTPSGQSKQKIIYTSATLGRPRQKDVRIAEPNLYTQIDLAHNLLSSNGKTSNVPYRESPPPSVANTWIPVNQALSLRSCQLQQQQIDVRVPPPIVCTRESAPVHQILVPDHRNSPLSPQVLDSSGINVSRF